MMIDTLTSEPFTAQIGKKLIIEGAEAELMLEVLDVKESPKAAGPDSKRTPFSVTLHGPDTPYLTDGTYHLRFDGEENLRLENVYLNRIIPPASSGGTGAFYQIIFG